MKRALKVALPIWALLISISTQANILGNMQTFQPTPDSTEFETVHSSRGLGEGWLNIGLFTAYQRNELTVFDSLTTTPRYLSYKDSSWQYDLVGAWGLTDHFSLTFANSGIWGQQAEDGQVVNGSTNNLYVTKGSQTLRPGLKYSFRSSPTGWGSAVLASVDFPMAGDDPYSGNSPKPIYNLEFAVDHFDRDAGIGFNAGYRHRQPGDPVANAVMFPLKDQLTLSAAYVYGLASHLRYHFELFGALPLQKNDYPEDGHENSLEALAALRFWVGQNLWLHVGATVELAAGGLSPDERGFVGLNWQFGETKKKSEPKAAALIALPDVVTVETGQSASILVKGGQGPYKYHVVQDFGAYDAVSRSYLAPDRVGETALVVTDQVGQSVKVPIHVVTPAAMAEPLQINPGQLEMFAGYHHTISVSGGTKPYSYRLANNSGTFDSDNMEYQAPYAEATDELIVTDAGGATARMPIHVSAIPQANKTIELHHLNFVFNTANLTPQSREELQKNFDQLKDVQIKKIVLIGHTDDIGKVDYNLRLSRQRAETIRRELINYLNLREDQVDAVGAGKSQPIADNATEEGRARNRRVELRLYREK